MEYPQEILNIAKNIKLVIFDVDGVLTDGGIYFTDEGREIKKFNVKDGLGLSWLAKTDITVAIITGRTSSIVANRMKNLGINHVYQGRMNKLETYHNLLDALKLAHTQVAYVGDDVIDLPIMKQCILPIAVADAHDSAKSAAKLITKNKGGQGAGREVCDLLLTAQDKIDDFSILHQ
ncbi:MAG TPA: 3-deoxy-manno-octulosonate-8-phosphatase KdsC [Gammaproteobacteria bacterium]|nr:3-deoxy-manno-octulosonate-8-phosphatase KdsC [Xanthomonadales bacterium]MCB1595142.1 3-deoxy-manno-octulosonate-8-phosphatase KdsC [Xanthomonadales bacterium]HPI95336.1 3-deoxy-manno-octulosonate-8-phosphatase KdsC [Gammaproteobacteria bacterium]HPQ86570.1 3-deoxy-manno-octulosonate-8-phosphatase KdsC [Gammaproteobacteria bacterium]